MSASVTRPADRTAESEPRGAPVSIAESIDAMPTGIYLAAALATLDVHSLRGSDRVAVLKAHHRMASHYAAKTYEAMGAIADAVAEEQTHPFDEAFEGATAEVRVALRLTRRAADTEFAFAHHLRTRLPSVAHMLEQGLIDVRRAKAIDYATGHLSAAAAQSVTARIAEAAPHLTTGQLTARIRKLSIASNPDDAADRYHRAVSDRRVMMEPTVDGTAHLHALDLPPDRVAAIRSRVQRLATSLRTAGESRSMDQLRADVFIDLLVGSTPAGDSVPPQATARNHGTVDIKVDLDTLVGLTDHPGDLGGYGPIIADLARRVADESHDAEWRVTVTDTATNRPLTTTTTRRRPTRLQTRRVQTSNNTCVFPGCRMPASTCDLDHIRAWSDDGSTDPENLAPLCRHDHRLKHTQRWQYQRDNEGRHVWKTALGQTVVKPRDPP